MVGDDLPNGLGLDVGVGVDFALGFALGDFLLGKACDHILGGFIHGRSILHAANKDKKMVPPGGIEPTTFRSGGERSIH